LVSVYYKNKKYNYQVVDSYLTAKDGTIDILRDKEQTVLTMITCVKNKKSKQVVYICNLVGTEDY
jgi:sortase (surface protein transpeptidase)